MENRNKSAKVARGVRYLALAAIVVLLAAAGAAVFPAVAGTASTPRLARQDTGTPMPAATPASPNGCFVDSSGEPAMLWARSELYFGTNRNEEDWLTFLADEVTPRFPDGLTVLTGLGQWRSSSDGEVSQQVSRVLIILYPWETKDESSVKLEEIRDEFEAQFDAESVLRTDESVPVCTSF